MTLAKLLTASCIAATSLASQAQSCPAAGSRYLIKGFTGDTPVTATGAALDPKWGCKWNTEDNRDLWWKMGADVVPAGGASSKPASANAASGASAGPLQPGRVYTCTLPGIGMFTGAYFGIVDRNTYRDVNSKRGSYQYDSQSGVLRLISGPGKGLAYKRQTENNFRVLDEAGKITGGNCVWNPSLSIQGRW